MLVDPANKKAIFSDREERLYVVDMPKGKVDLKDPVDLSDMRVPVDYQKEWAQIFDEAWRA